VLAVYPKKWAPVRALQQGQVPIFCRYFLLDLAAFAVIMLAAGLKKIGTCACVTAEPWSAALAAGTSNGPQQHVPVSY
jgi:hypothetical protein